MKISIITVCLNSELTIAKTINSILEQSHSDLELLVIDGLSTDNTIQVASSFKDQRVKVLSDKDNGIYNAMNKGLELATGDIILFLNSDDFLAERQVLSEVISLFDKTKADIIYGGIAYVGKNKKILYEWMPQKFKRKSYKNGFHTPHPAFYAKKKLYDKKGGFDENFKVAADFDLMLRFMEDAETKSVLSNKIMVHMSAVGFSSKLKNIAVGFFEIHQSLERHFMVHNKLTYSLQRYLPKLFKKLKLIKRGN